MIPALFALAAAMVIGGCAAVVQGFPYVRLESGLALVIAGAVAASSGTVLFGLGVVARGLRRVEGAFARTAAPAAPPVGEGRPRLPLPPTPEFGSPPEPSLPMPTIPVATIPMAPAEPDLPRIGPDLRMPAVLPPFPPPGPPRTIEPELPMPGLTPAPPAADFASAAETLPEPPSRPEPPEDDLFAPAETARLRPSLDAEPTGPEPTPERARTVVGRYASGGNTYVMFEDGSIEAETPQGRFTFTSLDELKAFVDGGGEAGTRGAA